MINLRSTAAITLVLAFVLGQPSSAPTSSPRIWVVTGQSLPRSITENYKSFTFQSRDININLSLQEVLNRQGLVLGRNSELTLVGAARTVLTKTQAPRDVTFLQGNELYSQNSIIVRLTDDGGSVLRELESKVESILSHDSQNRVEIQRFEISNAYRFRDAKLTVNNPCNTTKTYIWRTSDNTQTVDLLNVTESAKGEIESELVTNTGLRIDGDMAWFVNQNPSTDALLSRLGRPAVESTYAKWVNQAGYTGAGVTVAVLDTGLPSNPDSLPDSMRGKILWSRSQNFTLERIEDQITTETPKGHGSSIIPILLSVAPGVSVLPIKVCQNSDGKCRTASVFNGICYALSQVNDATQLVLNLSMSGTNRDAEIENLLTFAISKGVLVATSAGNNSSQNRDVPRYPGAADIPGVIAVSGLNPNSQGKWQTSPDYINAGYVDIFAPALNITSLRPDGRVDFFSGTSFAVPLVSAAIAICKQVYREKAFEKLLIPNVNDTRLAVAGGMSTATSMLTFRNCLPEK